jgi:2'-hydroxyisoflavone reductase
MAAGGALSLGLVRCANPGERGDAKAPKPLRILILGGTKFIGPPMVEYALQRGHEVTLFNRGKTNPELFPDVEKLRGDRENDLESLKGRQWDAVIDNSASVPLWVRDSAGLLKDAASLYLFTSSISVYSDNSIPGMDESGPLAVLEDPAAAEEITSVRQVTGANYGALKALCEQEAQKAFGEGAIIVRPGLIVGPMDPSDRFTYWPVRIDRGGEVLAPNDPTDPVQIIDARDLANWYIKLVEEGRTGVYNATGPESPLPIGQMLERIESAIEGQANFTWVDADFLAQHEVQAWMHMTTWVPPRDGYEGFSRTDCSKAIAAGLTFRPLEETARDTLVWWKTLDEERRANPRAGLPADKEAEVLAAWHAREQTSSGAGE